MWVLGYKNNTMSLMLKPLWHGAPMTSYTFTNVSLNCWSVLVENIPVDAASVHWEKNQTWNQFSFCCERKITLSTDGVSTVLGRGSNRGEEDFNSSPVGSWQRELHLELCYRQTCAGTIRTRLPAPWSVYSFQHGFSLLQLTAVGLCTALFRSCCETLILL